MITNVFRRIRIWRRRKQQRSEIRKGFQLGIIAAKLHDKFSDPPLSTRAGVHAFERAFSTQRGLSVD